MCFTKDAAHYREILRLARQMEGYCSGERRGKFLLIWSDPDAAAEARGEQRVSIPVYVAERRARRPFAPQAVVFARCDVLPWEPEWQRVWFSESAGAHFDFASVWTLSKTIIVAGATSAFITEGVTRWVQPETNFLSDSFLLVKWPGQCRQVWPQLDRGAEAKKVDPPELSSLLQKAAPAPAARRIGPSVSGFVGAQGAPRRRKPAAAPMPGDPEADDLFSHGDGATATEDDGPVPEGPDEGRPPPPPGPPGGAPAGAAGGPVEPPPPPPPADYDGRPGGDYEVLQLPGGGSLHFSATLKVLNAHCDCKAHRGGPKCKMDRRLVLSDGRRRRPVGLLAAWLRHLLPTKPAHDRAKKELGKLGHRAARVADRAIVEEIAARDGADGRLARRILEAEGDAARPEPDTVT